MRTITGLYDTRAQAEKAVTALEVAGIPSNDISIVSNHGEDADNETYAGEGAGSGAGIGAVTGGGAGLLAGLGLMAIPGLGPVVAAGWLAATAAGAVAGAAAGSAVGGIVGSLIKADIPEANAHIYAEGVRRGGTLVVARVNESKIDTANAILREADPVDPVERRKAYEAEGWREFDPTGAPYRSTSAETENFRYRNVP